MKKQSEQRITAPTEEESEDGWRGRSRFDCAEGAAHRWVNAGGGDVQHSIAQFPSRNEHSLFDIVVSKEVTAPVSESADVRWSRFVNMRDGRSQKGCFRKKCTTVLGKNAQRVYLLYSGCQSDTPHSEHETWGE